MPEFKSKHSRARQWTVGAILALLCSGAQSENLLDVLQMALDQDPEYLSAESANRAAQEQIPLARAQLLPDASFTGSIEGVNQKDREAGGNTNRFADKSFVISISQPIFRKELLVGLDQADHRVQQAKAQYAFALQDLMLRVAENYFGVLEAFDELDSTRAARDANEQQLKQSQQRFDVGLIAITDVEEAKAGFDLASASVIAAENDVDNAVEGLREVTGRYLTDLNTLRPDTPLLTPEPNNIDAWTQTALEQNLLLIAANLATNTAHDEIRRQQAGHLPTLDLVADHGYSKSGGRFGDSELMTSSIGIQFTVPIYQGGEVLSRTREARHLHQKSLDDLERQRRITQRQARDAFRGVISGISRVEALAQAVVSTESALEAIEAGFHVGTRTSVDVLDVQRELYRARFDHAQARYAYIVDILRLKQAAGTLSQDDLAEVNSWLQ